MELLASGILSDVSKELHDTANTRWPLDDLIGYLNDGQRVMVIHRPDATATTGAVQLAAGVRQAIPDDGYRFLKLFNNQGADGATEGDEITYVDLDTQRSHNPGWRSAKAKSEVKEYLFDPLDSTHFYVSPPVPATPDVYVMLQYSKHPKDVPKSTDALKYHANHSVIAVKDIYRPALVNYILHRAYLRNDEAADRSKAAEHYAWFLNDLGVKTEKDALSSPAVRDEPYAGRVPRQESVVI